ncbi:MAG: SUMF1/EgtB/PvdO family nonheme iron enzyme [Acidobacteria bacterium]|nr:SUMF1/EgtB/PvdO family nonheme iron enzyme [Acidobacteriota bacterium]
MLRSGDKIGLYTLIRKLGKGAFGEVWLVEEHDAILSSQFALKILFDEDADLDAVKQEASVWLQASGHPNVMPIHKASVYDGQFVIVSEYAPNGSLKDWLKQHGSKAPSIKEAIRLTDGILAGLEHLHARRIIHRDIKPDNVLMQGATPRLADFGISRILKSTVHSQALAGTPQYMAPEAFRGERDEQTDVWAVGVLLYQMVGGRLPFSETDLYGLMNQVANTKPLPLGADVPEPLQKVIAKAMEKEQARRYRSASEMREALHEVQRQIEEAERKWRWLEEQKRIEAQQRQQLEDQKKQPAVERDTEATIIREPQPVKVEVQKSLKFDSPKRSSRIPKEVPPQPLAKPKRSPVLIGGGVFVALIFLVAAIVLAVKSFKPANPTAPTNLIATTSTSEIIKQIEAQMVQIPGGTFMMGSPKNEQGRNDKEWPQHQVTVSSFYLGKYEVTQAQWREVASLPKVKIDLNATPSRFNGDNLPVETVSWDEAVEFCERLSRVTRKMFRLPTEAEWEYACRAGTRGRYAGNLDKMTWYDNNSDNTTHQVGEKQANAWGLYDMQGNVSEWCRDAYGAYSSEAQRDPTGANSGVNRMRRGGRWNHNARICRSAYRSWITPDYRAFSLGFRLVRTYP